MTATPDLAGWGCLPDDFNFNLADLLTEPEDWQKRALCAQTFPDAFYPEVGESTREATRVCLACEVKDECLEYALANDEQWGIWGGLSTRQRRKLKKYGSLPKESAKVRARKERDERIIDLRGQGLLTPDIAQVLGVGQRTVLRVVARAERAKEAA